MRFNYWQKFYEGNFYHIYNRANNREHLFINDHNYRFFLEKWTMYLHPYLETYAYTLMWNHFHFIVRVRPIDEDFKRQVAKENTAASHKFLSGEILLKTFIEDQFKRLFTSYADAFNKSEKRRGSLFQKRFKRVQIDNEVVLLNKICYVHHNPIHHGITKCFNDWRYTSYTAYLSNKPTLIARQQGLMLFHNLEPSIYAYTQYHELFKNQQRGLLRDDDMDIRAEKV